MRQIVMSLISGILLSSLLSYMLLIQPSSLVIEGIRTEALRQGTKDFPLPLAGHWNTGQEKDGFSPSYQLSMIERGHYLLPWFLMPDTTANPDDQRWIEYYETAIKRAGQLNLPISFVGTQWEFLLTTDEFFNLPPDNNPNVVAADGQVSRSVSPFGPVSHWEEVGMKWGSSRMIKKLQEWYPNPPLVLFVSNNEQVKLEWTNVEEDRRYLKLFGAGHDDNFKRKVVGDGWIERYRALQQGIRTGLSARAWKQNAVFIGYSAFGPSHFGRWDSWMEHSLYTTGRIDPSPLAWDGGTPPFYTFDWATITDYTVYSPQVEGMNWVFMQKEARKLNPRFWFEISTWDGFQPGPTDKRDFYKKQGQTFTPERYGGMVQFGMWLLRPKVVREFRGYRDTLVQAEPYFLPIVDAVDRVHKNPTLKDFWRRGELVANRSQSHPYQSLIPKEYQTADRWYLPDTQVDPARPWELGTALPVYTLALVKGTAPARSWLLYVYSPLGPRQSVQVSIPEYRAVTVNATLGGSFYLVEENNQQVQSIN
jgi:hypothetical protein